MDESVKRFKAEQKRIKDAGGPWAALRQTLASNFLTLVVFGIAFYSAMSFMNLFPRDSDNSVRFTVVWPTAATLGIISALILRFSAPRVQAIRWTCWGFIAFALIVVPIGFYDYLIKSGS